LNTPVAVVIAGGGISDRPDFVNIENVQTQAQSQKVTYVFEEALDGFSKRLGPDSPYLAVMSDGRTAFPPVCAEVRTTTPAGTCHTANKDPELSSDRKKVTVTFTTPTGTACTATSTDSRCEGGRLDQGQILYHTVLTDAVRSFASQQWNFADTIRVATPIIYEPGETLAPDLASVRVRYTPEEINTGVSCTAAKLEIQVKFDENFTKIQNDDFTLWILPRENDNNPRSVQLVTGQSPTTAASEVKKEWSGTCATGNLDASEPNPDGDGAGAGIEPDASGVESDGSNIKYISVGFDRLRTVSGINTYKNLPSGVAVPN